MTHVFKSSTNKKHETMYSYIINTMPTDGLLTQEAIVMS